MVDYIGLADVAIGFFFVVLALVLLGRYQLASRRISESADLNHDLWMAMEERLKKQDERILDLMGRVEVLQARYVSGNQSPKPVMPREIQQSQPITYLQPPREPRIQVRLRPEADDTERTVIRLLADGAKSTIEVKEVIRKSREHTARLMKALFDKGLVTRDDSVKPYVYQLTDKGREYLPGA